MLRKTLKRILAQVLGEKSGPAKFGRVFVENSTRNELEGSELDIEVQRKTEHGFAVGDGAEQFMMAYVAVWANLIVKT